MLSRDEYLSRDATDLADLVRRGEVDALELLETAIARTEATNGRLNAVITPMFDAAEQAVKAGLPDGPFRGVPFLLKDLDQPFAGVPMSQGCRSLTRRVSDHDSELVRRFKAAGLVTIGKTNTPEFGLMGVTEPEAFGPTHNPWDPGRTPGGSSGGSAAAVAAGMTPMASGGDGGGSIRIPSSYCGLFGLKPTRGRTPLGPDAGERWQGAVVDHVLTRSVRDSARMLDALAGPAEGAPYRIEPPEGAYADAVAAQPRRLRVAVRVAPFQGTPVHASSSRAVQDAANLLEDLGHRVDEASPRIDGDALRDAYMTMYYGEVAADVAALGHVLGRRPRSGDVEQVTWTLAQLGRSFSAGDFVSAKRRWNDFGREMGRFHRDWDVLLTPTVAQPPSPIGGLRPTTVERALMSVLARLSLTGPVLRATGLVDRMASRALARTPFTQLANLTGQPAMSVPLAHDADGLPVGVQFVAPVGDEATLLRLARQLEEARPWFDRRPPDP